MPIDIFFTPKDKTKVKVDIENNIPIINVDVSLEGKISSVAYTHNYLEEQNLKELENSANEYIKGIFMDYFIYTSRKCNSDIGGLGKYFVNRFLTWQAWENFDWQNAYGNAKFNVNVNTTITSSYLLLET